MEISDYFYYEDGKLFNKIDRGRAKKGEQVGSDDGHGYLRCRFEIKRWQVHRLIYTLLKGEIPDGLQIDHINGDRLDNRIENLRLVTSQENHFNRTTAKGFYWNKQAKKWVAQIMANGKVKHLGYYDTTREARAAYLRAKRDMHIIKER